MATGAPEKRRSRSAVAVNRDRDLANWWSVHFGANGVQQLNAAQLLKDARGAKKCVVVSAYLTMDWFEKLLKAVPATCEVRVHLNAGELVPKPTLRAQLGEEIERRSPLLQVLSHQPPGGMFHTKLYGFHDGRAWTIWTGSANASMQAFAANEELMLRARGAIVSPLIGYLARLKKDGDPFEDSCTELPPDDVRALLLDGRL